MTTARILRNNVTEYSFWKSLHSNIQILHSKTLCLTVRQCSHLYIVLLYNNSILWLCGGKTCFFSLLFQATWLSFLSIPVFDEVNKVKMRKREYWKLGAVHFTNISSTPYHIDIDYKSSSLAQINEDSFS